IRVLDKEKIDAIVSDYQMPGMDGIQFLVEVRKRSMQIPFILFTGRGREEIVIQAINSGADFYLQKGGDPVAQFAELSHKIRQAALRNRTEDLFRKSEEKYRHLIEHADEVIVVEDPRLKEYSILPFASVIEQVIKERRPEIGLFGATTSGRELAPRLGSRLGSGVTADCTILKVGEFIQYSSKTIWSPCLEAIRPTYGESKLATIIGFRCPQMATARPGTFEALKPDLSRQGKTTVFVPRLDSSLFAVEIVNTERKEGGDDGLFTASIIVAGGRPCGEQDDFKLIKDLVTALEEKGISAAWGATRQAVDHGYAPYSRQIGQTGKTVRPKVYIAVAVSGAIQHVSGMKESGRILAINQDRQANIFHSSDYGIVGGYLETLPALIAKVKAGFTFGLKS
ncbi:MAG: FAD-binding protein, partial [Candidatus Omnitrophota bacterium]